MSWLPYLSIIFGVLSLTYAFRGRTVSQFPSQRGMFLGTGLALLATGGWILIHPASPAINSGNLLTGLSIFLTALIAGLMVSYPFMKKRAGELLFAVPRLQSRKISGYATAGMFLVLIIFTVIRTEFTRETIAEIVFYASVVFYFASPLFGRVELRQSGIVESYSLLRWKYISSYRWVGRDGSDLMMTVNGMMRKRVTMFLPPDQKESIDAVLKKQLNDKEHMS